MLQPPDVLSSSLFVDSSLIESLECIICTNVLNDPITCRNGHGFCRTCLEESMKTKKQCPTCKVAMTRASIGSNLYVKNQIENAHMYCFTRLEALEAANTSNSSNAVTDVDANDDDDDDDDVIDEAAGKKRTRAVPTGSESSSSSSSSSSRSSSSGPAAAKRAKSDICTWTGKLHGAKQHFKECVYAGALCGFGCGAVVRRIDMSEHEASLCPKQVQCTNVGCTAVMPEPMIAAHKANDCPYEVVDCPFSCVGCNERVLRKDVESHEEAAMKQHNRLLMQGMQTQQQDNLSFRQDNHSFRQDNLSFRQDILSSRQDIQLLRQDNLSLQQKVAEQEKRLDRQLHQLVYKVKLADLVRAGEVNMQSDEKMFGAYKAYVHVQKGHANNGDCCGVYLCLKNSPFPCHVSRTFEIVHWDGKPESACKKENTATYEEAEGDGWSKFIPLSKLTAAASPYVKDGHVTFIVNHRKQ